MGEEKLRSQAKGVIHLRSKLTSSFAFSKAFLTPQPFLIMTNNNQA